MQAANKVLTALKAGHRPLFGAWQTLPDAEHGNIDGMSYKISFKATLTAADAAMHDAVGAIAACGVSPLVRIPASEGWMVKRALDAGAHGIIVPLIRTADEARKIVQAAKFPPMGIRGFGSPFPMEKFGGNLSAGEYLQQANESLLTIIQIETREALADVDAIAAIEGIDVLFVGPFDLGNNIGYPIKGAEMAAELGEAIAKVLRSGKTHKKPVAIYAVNGEQARDFARQGFDMISVINDVGALQMCLSSALRTAKSE